MAEILRLFVAATADLTVQRAVVGQAVAELPVQVGVEIRRSPPLLPTLEEVFEKVSNVDRVFFLLGNDITAPSGLEWRLAWQLERSVLPLRRRGRPTPAAQEFARLSPLPWIDFQSDAELRRLIVLDVARLLKHPANRYGLTLPELERLEHHLRLLERPRGPASAAPDAAAEGGGVLLDGKLESQLT